MERKPLFSVVLSALLAGTGSAALAANDNQAECSVASLEGSYLYGTWGALDGEPYASAGIMVFDGNGSIALLATRSVEREQLRTDGTYTIETNCSGSMQLGTGTVNHFYLGPSGDSFRFVRTTDEGAVGGEAERVTRGLIVEIP